MASSFVVKKQKIDVSQSNKKLDAVDYKTLDPETRKAFTEYRKIAKQIAKLEDQIRDLESKRDKLGEALFGALSAVQNRTIKVNDLLVYLQDRKVMVKKPKYKDAVQFLLPKITDELREAVNEFLKAEYELRTYIKTRPAEESIAGKVLSVLDKAKGVAVAVLKKIKGYIKSIFSHLDKVDSYIDQFEKKIA